MNRLTNLLTSTYFLALVISIIIIIFLPPIFKKYNAEITKSWVIQKENGLLNYSDLDNDGYSEQIILYLSLKKEPAVRIENHLGGILGQWNFDGTFPGGNITPENFLSGDYDNNSLNEIYFLTQYGQDSVYLNILETHADSTTFRKKKFITKIDKADTTVHYFVSLNTIHDLNNDSFKEIIFCIKAGFSLQPRAVYAYDIFNDSLMVSPQSGIIKGEIKIADINNDNNPEIFCKTSARGNIHDSLGIPYSDYNNWLMVYDNNLNYFFNPICFYGNPSGITCEVKSNNMESQFYVLFYCSDKKGVSLILSLFNSEGEKIKEKDISQKFKENAFLLKYQHKGKEKIIIYDCNGKTYTINDKFELINYKNIENKIRSCFSQVDLNNDNDIELIFISYDNNGIVITQDNLDYPVLVNTPRDNFYKRFLNISILKNGNKNPLLFIQNGANCYLISYDKNPLFYFKYLIYIGIYLFFLAFILIIQKIQQIRQKKQIELERKISELQFSYIKGQIDPHFTFNALNSISSLILKEKKETAYNFISKFSALIRATVINSDKIDRTLKEEIDFVSNYLELQKFRFKNKFDFEISPLSDKEANIMLPQMLIQNFVENAVKHGLKFSEKEGLLKIDFIRRDKKIFITVEDNGIGRERAKEVSLDSTGKGLIIVDKILNLYFKIKHIQIKYKIEDLIDENSNATGTKVLIEIPLLKSMKT